MFGFNPAWFAAAGITFALAGYSLIPTIREKIAVALVALGWSLVLVGVASMILGNHEYSRLHQQGAAGDDPAPSVPGLPNQPRKPASPSISVSFYHQTLITFTHGLKTKKPQITCLDPGGIRMYPAAITPLDENTVVLNMVTPQTGSCGAENQSK